MIDKYQISNKKSFAIGNWKLEIGNFRRGFTLIEILIGVSILAVLGTITLSILFMTFRAGKKSDSLIVLKQNGNAAISQVTKNIRYAKSLDMPTDCTAPTPVPQASIVITSQSDNGQTTFSCNSGSPPTIASNGASLIDTSIARVTECSFTCTQVTLYDPPTINFKFKLSSQNANGLVETTGVVPFETSVTMRNYTR